jgi:hypothetical protein
MPLHKYCLILAFYRACAHLFCLFQDLTNKKVDGKIKVIILDINIILEATNVFQTIIYAPRGQSNERIHDVLITESLTTTICRWLHLVT